MKNKVKKHSHMVRVESDGNITPELEAEIKALLGRSDDDVDASDPENPEWTADDFKKARHFHSKEADKMFPQKQDKEKGGN